MTKITRVLPADVYDTLELSALAFGGIGAGQFAQKLPGEQYQPGRQDVASGHGAPYCVLGHAAAAESLEFRWDNGPVTRALADADLTFCDNDDAVCAINSRRGREQYDRVTFKQWTKELGVVRGDA
jgi:hypothetical protein